MDIQTASFERIQPFSMRLIISIPNPQSLVGFILKQELEL